MTILGNPQIRPELEATNGRFFYDFMPLADELGGQADKLQGQNVPDDAAVVPLENAAAALNTVLNGARLMPGARLIIVAEGRLKTPEEYAQPVQKAGSVELSLPTSVITSMQVNPRLSSGPSFHRAIASAREAMAASKYAAKHSDMAACSRSECLCQLTVVDASRVLADASPVIDMRLQAGGDPATSVYDEDLQIVEQPNPGGWYRFPLRTLVQIGLVTDGSEL